MEQFIDLLKSSVIVQGSITFVLVMTYCYLVATNQTIPTNFMELLYVVVGFYFGAKVQNLVNKAK